MTDDPFRNKGMTDRAAKARAMGEMRTPYDGQPYFCIYCGLSFAEYMACDSTNCQLETRGAAIDRAEKRHWEQEAKP